MPPVQAVPLCRRSPDRVWPLLLLLSVATPAFAASPQGLFEPLAGQVRELEVAAADGRLLATHSA
ncbi:hypothetical protein, partial [Accumulibacter sp.]|uniref:hypothetical protein n=1 Tax=Accumulibacter sp. TaxID=2053492 RepID=UPI002BBD0038